MSDRDTYYAAARSWADGQTASAAWQVRIAWIVAGGFGVIALVLAAALMLLVPLKSTEPYVLTVDRQTGAVERATTLAEGQLTQNEAVIQAQLAAYVLSRETFDATDLAQKYRQVQLLSAPSVASSYVEEMRASNPLSPLRTLSRGDTLAVTIRSISLMAPGTALVRFTATRMLGDGRRVSDQPYVAAISYGFSGKPLRLGDRFENPLGFQVTRYRRDAEGISS